MTTYEVAVPTPHTADADGAVVVAVLTRGFLVESDDLAWGQGPVSGHVKVTEVHPAPIPCGGRLRWQWGLESAQRVDSHAVYTGPGTAF
jgi:hypothetical protein